jgi:hypothetical protein
MVREDLAANHSAGEIGVIRIGGAVKIPEAELEKFLSERFTPARNRREARPQTVAEAIDRVLLAFEPPDESE